MSYTNNYYLHHTAETVNNTTYPANQSDNYYLRRILQGCTGESQVECQNRNWYYYRIACVATGEELEPLQTNNYYLHQIAEAVSDVHYLSVKSDNFYLEQIYTYAENLIPNPKTDVIVTLETPVIVYTDNFNVTGRVMTDESTSVAVANAPVKLVWGYNGQSYEASGTTGSDGKVTFSREAVTTVASYNFKLVYEGGQDYNSGQSSVVSVTPTKEVSYINLSSYTGTVYIDGNATVSGVLEDNDTGKISGATIEISDGNTVLTTVTTGSDGSFSKSFPLTTAGSHSINLDFAGDSIHTGTSQTCTITANSPTWSIAQTGKTILSYADRAGGNEYCTLTATYHGAVLTGKTVEVYRQDSSSPDPSTDTLLGTMTDNGDGTYTYTYDSAGVGDFVCYVQYGSLLIQTYSISDIFKYHENEITKTSSSATTTRNSVFTGLSTDSDHFQVEFDVKASSDGFAMGIGSADNSSFQYSILIGYNSSPQCWRTWKATSSTTNTGTTSNVSFTPNTYATIKIVYDNGTVDIYADNTLVIQYTGLSSLFDGINKSFDIATWKAMTVYIKNVKIKPL